jgi:type I restriction enzyme S subunit
MEYRYERQKLSAVFDIISGGTPKRSVSDYWGGDIPWISIQDFNDRSRFIDCTEEFISEEGFKNSSTNILEKRDIIISARGTVGKVNIIGSPMAFNQSCYGLRVRDNIYYLFAYYSLINSIRELKVRSYGSVFSTITKRTFDEVEINVFNFCDQLRVSALLGSLDSKIELNNKIITNLEAQAQAIFKSWFVDFEPFQDGEFVESELGLIPEGWMVSTTGREFDIEYGKNLPTKHLLEKGYPVF